MVGDSLCVIDSDVFVEVHTRVVSPRRQLKREWSPVASPSPSQQKLSQHLKYMVRARISEFESSHPSHAVSLCGLMSAPTGELRLFVRTSIWSRHVLSPQHPGPA